MDCVLCVVLCVVLFVAGQTPLRNGVNEMCEIETIENSWSVCDCVFEIEVFVPATELWILFAYADGRAEARGRVTALEDAGIRARMKVAN